MFRRRLRLVLVVCFGLLLVKLLLSVSVGRISLSRQTANGRPEGDNGSPSSHFDPDKFVQGLAEPRLFFEGLGTLASEALPSQIGDRLLEQLRSLSRLEDAKRRLGARLTSLPRLVPHFDDKLILATAGVGVDRRLLKREAFIADRCPINNCYLMDDLTELPPGVRRPDVVLYRTRTSQLNTLSEQRTKDEIWITWQLECPISAPMVDFLPNQLPNWTASYRSDSTIVTPYGRYVSSSLMDKYQLRELAFATTSRKNLADGKTKMVAWFVSNCQSSNERRRYVDELSRYVQVDIYGLCGTLECAKSDKKCIDRLRRDYKFYLAFENSNCREYITEKLYENAYSNDVVPVVMGAHPDDYRAVAPPHSYIHVDDFESPRHLADYLKLLDQNDTLYNEYFAWKGTGSFINTKFWCRLCAMLHARDKTNYVHTYSNLADWWIKDQCLTDGGRFGASWRRTQNVTSNPDKDKMTSR